MKAIVQREYGSGDVLEFTDVAMPPVEADQVRVQVRAAGVNSADLFMMRGEPLALRLYAGLRRPRHAVPGTDLAGVVESVGANVTRWEPGEEVFGWGTGAYAEYAVTDQDQLTVKPDGVTFEEAAGVGVAAFTGLQAMRDVAEVGPGTTVLINGASGGVGTFAVQVAKHLGAEVTGVCSTRNVDLVTSLGADHVIDYTQQGFTTLGTRYDVVLDNVANHPMSVLLRQVVAPRGMLIPNNGTTGGPVIGSIGRMAVAFAWSPFIRQQIRPFLSLQKPEDLQALGEMLEEGTLRAVIDQTFALPDAQAAMRRMATGRVRGKVVITP